MEARVDVLSQSGSAVTYVQPSSGEYWALRAWGSEIFSGSKPTDAPMMTVGCGPGSNPATIYRYDRPTVRAAGDRFTLGNTNRLCVTNNSASATKTFYSAALVS